MNAWWVRPLSDTMATWRAMLRRSASNRARAIRDSAFFDASFGASPRVVLGG